MRESENMQMLVSGAENSWDSLYKNIKLKSGKYCSSSFLLTHLNSLVAIFVTT